METSPSARTRDRGTSEPPGKILSAAAVAAACCLVLTFTASAQQSLPGLVIAAPPPAGGPQPGAPLPGVMISPMGQPPMMPPQASPQPAPQAKPPAAKPKPKPKVAAKPKDDGDTAGGAGKGSGPTRIALLVNGDPITAYEIEQRARLLALSSDIQSKAQENMKRLATSEQVTARWKQIVQETIEANQRTKTREQIIAIIQEKQKAYSMGLQKQAIDGARSTVLPGLRDKARKELIEEQVKLQDAKLNKAAPDETMVDDLIKDLAKRNGKTQQQFVQQFAGLGVDVATLRQRFRAQLAWTETVRKQYSHLAVPNNRDLDRLVGEAVGVEDQVELQLQRIMVPVPPKLDQKSMAQKLGEAEQLQRQFSNCRTMAALAARIQGSRFEQLGSRKLSSFSEPSRSMLSSAQEGTMIPPTMQSGGIEFLAVCGRRLIKATDIKRNEVANEFRQEQFERLSRAHLRKLMDTAVIETR